MTNAIPFDSADEDTATRTLGGEARGEEYLGQVAVVWVMRNRLIVDPKVWGTSISRVCRKPYQFSAWNGHPDEDPDLKWMLDLRMGSPTYISLRNVVRDVLSGSMGDPTYGCTFYKRPSAPAQWAVGHLPRVSIGKHDFYALTPEGVELPDPRKEKPDEPTVA